MIESMSAEVLRGKLDDSVFLTKSFPTTFARAQSLGKIVGVLGLASEGSFADNPCALKAVLDFPFDERALFTDSYLISTFVRPHDSDMNQIAVDFADSLRAYFKSRLHSASLVAESQDFLKAKTDLEVCLERSRQQGTHYHKYLSL